MAEIVRFDNEEGAAVLVEAAGSSPQMRDVSGRDILRDSDQTIQRILGRVRDLSALVVREMRGVAAEADELSVQLGMKISAEADVFLAKATGESSIQVTITWRRGDAPR
ncbi:CU044_2847 family protein [Nocardiopsis potens]|uniref:CU044_2847 family protein n=1 Tax=Nocardiopsis potens TaxID=1246458 RepID=UPI00034AC2DA|nr:CU044_2847 family protein [Nocardiopsis potens]